MRKIDFLRFFDLTPIYCVSQCILGFPAPKIKKSRKFDFPHTFLNLFSLQSPLPNCGFDTLLAVPRQFWTWEWAQRAKFWKPRPTWKTSIWHAKSSIWRIMAKLVNFTSPLTPQNALTKVMLQWETVLGVRETLWNHYLVRRSGLQRFEEKLIFS